MKSFFLLLSLLFFMVSCTESSGTVENSTANDNKSTVEKAEATFVHTVFFWMKEDFSASEAAFFEEGLEKLGKVPSIHSYKWGKPAGTARDVVDNSYTYAWIVDFTSAEKEAEYQDDPIHLTFIDSSSHLWTKVVVYDTVLK